MEKARADHAERFAEAERLRAALARLGVSTAGGLAIAPLPLEEADAAAALWEAAGLTRPWNDPVADIRAALAYPSSTVLAGRDGDGRLIATVMAGYDGHRGWLYYLAVADSRRGEGIGRIMVGAAERWLAAQGAPARAPDGARRQ